MGQDINYLTELVNQTLEVGLERGGNSNLENKWVLNPFCNALLKVGEFHIDFNNEIRSQR